MRKTSMYQPIVTVTHGDGGEVVRVEIDWSESQLDVDEDGSTLPTDDWQIALSEEFDRWLNENGMRAWVWPEEVA
jgi:hypothetical protein